MRFALRSLGWLFISAGVLVALYLVYALYGTGLATSQAQDRLLQEFEDQMSDVPTPHDQLALSLEELPPLSVEESENVAADPLPIPEGLGTGDVLGVMEFYRPSDGNPVVIDEPVALVEGVTVDALKQGPGRYPGTSYPGQMGNFAVAGHRTTYGAPFWNLDQLREGDEIHVTDRNGTRWIYEFVAQQIVAPIDTSVLRSDPLALGRPMLTLTTCNPRWSQRERLIVFAELSEEQLPLVQT